MNKKKIRFLMLYFGVLYDKHIYTLLDIYKTQHIFVSCFNVFMYPIKGTSLKFRWLELPVLLSQSNLTLLQGNANRLRFNKIC